MNDDDTLKVGQEVWAILVDACHPGDHALVYGRRLWVVSADAHTVCLWGGDCPAFVPLARVHRDEMSARLAARVEAIRLRLAGRRVELSPWARGEGA